MEVDLKNVKELKRGIYMEMRTQVYPAQKRTSKETSKQVTCMFKGEHWLGEQAPSNKLMQTTQTDFYTSLESYHVV